MTTISVAKDFATTPGGRFRRHGRFSGEQFREEVLFPQIELSRSKNEKVVIDLDGVAGIPSSFLEEVVGGLIRKYGHPIVGMLEIRTTDPSLKPYVLLAEKFMREATV